MQSKSLELIENTVKDGFYSQHLADLSNKGNHVHTSEDILNNDGVILIRKGATIDTNLRSKLLRHKL